MDPKTRTYLATNNSPKVIVWIAAVLSIILSIMTIGVVYYSWGGEHGTELLYIFIGFWAVVPPVWFWVEYFYVYRAYGEPDTLELFKYGQDVSKAIWAGVLAILVAFAASDAAKPKTIKCTLDCPSAAAFERLRPPAK